MAISEKQRARFKNLYESLEKAEACEKFIFENASICEKMLAVYNDKNVKDDVKVKIIMSFLADIQMRRSQ